MTTEDDPETLFPCFVFFLQSGMRLPSELYASASSQNEDSMEGSSENEVKPLSLVHTMWGSLSAPSLLLTGPVVWRSRS